jgi:hypothetical protein
MINEANDEGFPGKADTSSEGGERGSINLFPNRDDG